MYTTLVNEEVLESKLRKMEEKNYRVNITGLTMISVIIAVMIVLTAITL